MDWPLIYTIGHSTHPLEHFLSLLREYAIDCLVDVRSIAASARNPQYNKQPLSKFLKANNIAYLHFAEEFGARQTDPGLLDDNGKVDFEKVRRSPIFRRGIDRLSNGVTKGHIITLMCAESDPFDCHRFSMISPGLQNAGFQVQHILKDKTIISNEALEQQLLKKYARKLPQPTMFQPAVSTQEQLKLAYRLRNKDIGFSNDATRQIP